MADKDKKGDEKKEGEDGKDDKKGGKDEEEEEGCCSACWNGYCACFVATCKVNNMIIQCIYNTITGIKNCIVFSLASCWYPMKERCCNCCESCDKKMNPYKDPYHNPYDTI